jgi:DeoR family lactose phosphotransferase system repressor
MKAHRQQQLMILLGKDLSVQVNNLAKTLGVSEMTIRRDLNDLHQQGLLKRTFGGALMADKSAIPELSHNEKETVNRSGKRHIAQLAAQLIADGDVIYLGAGTTCELLVKEILPKKITIITNSLAIFDHAQNQPNFEVILSGGHFRHKTQMFVGQYCENVFKQITINKSFMSCNGVSLKGYSVSNQLEASINILVAQRSKNVYMLADSAKFDLDFSVHFLPLAQVRCLITNKTKSVNLTAYKSFVSILY